MNDQALYDLVSELLKEAAPDAHARIFDAPADTEDEAAQEQERLFGIVRGYLDDFEEQIIHEARGRL